MLLGLDSSFGPAEGKADLAGIRAEVVVLVVSTCLRLAPVIADAKEAMGVLPLPSPRVTAVEVDRRLDSTLAVAFEDREDFFKIPGSRPDTNYLR